VRPSATDPAEGSSRGEHRTVLEWATARLHVLGTPATGAAEPVKDRPWSTVHRVPVHGGVVWVKACGGRTRYEAPLTVALAGWVPDLVLRPLATDDERGWLLLPDGGVPLREHQDGTDPRVWERFVREYTGLQRAVAPHAAELLALGVPDQRPSLLPALLDGLLDEPGDDGEVPLDGTARSAVRRLRPAFADACAELAAGLDGTDGLAASVQHDDLHAGNVLPAAQGAGGDRFFDWGDAAVAHPFGTLLVTLRSMAATLGLRPDDVALMRVRDAYLDAWGVEPGAGVRAARLAAWTGCVGRALAWRRALAGASVKAAAEWGDAVPGWVGELLEPTPDWFLPGPPR